MEMLWVGSLGEEASVTPAELSTWRGPRSLPSGWAPEASPHFLLPMPGASHSSHRWGDSRTAACLRLPPWSPDQPLSEGLGEGATSTQTLSSRSPRKSSEAFGATVLPPEQLGCPLRSPCPLYVPAGRCPVLACSPWQVHSLPVPVSAPSPPTVPSSPPLCRGGHFGLKAMSQGDTERGRAGSEPRSPACPVHPPARSRKQLPQEWLGLEGPQFPSLVRPGGRRWPGSSRTRQGSPGAFLCSKDHLGHYRGTGLLKVSPHLTERRTVPREDPTLVSHVEGDAGLLPQCPRTPHGINKTSWQQ